MARFGCLLRPLEATFCDCDRANQPANELQAAEFISALAWIGVAVGPGWPIFSCSKCGKIEVVDIQAAAVIHERLDTFESEHLFCARKP